MTEQSEIPADLYSLLDDREDHSSYAWRHRFFRALAEGCFYNYGTATGPGNRLYVAVTLQGREGDELLSFDTVNAYAFERGAGIILMRDPYNQVPEEVLHFGCVWSYREYGDLRGCSNLVFDYEDAAAQNPQDPPQAIAEGKPDEMTYSLPSEEFLPLYVRELIAEDVRSVVPAAIPEFALVEQERFIMSLRIRVGLNAPCTDEQKAEIESRITWFMPPYLPIYAEV